MCGINGFIARTGIEESKIKGILGQMNDLIIHRGPDEDGIYTFSSEGTSVGMAMRRLSIIDLSTGQQPMHTDNKDASIVFNGEIYNFQNIKRNLENDGVQFKTTSDTEVILKLYEKKGIAGFKELDGMYAFSIHDKKNNKVIITRDFFGEKPLYYTKANGIFYWASELKSIVKCLDSKPDINRQGLNLFLRLTYIPAPFTIYEGIHKLEPNSYIDMDLETGKLTIESIHSAKEIIKSDLSFDDAKKKVKDMVTESVESRSISDVPLGTFLSGGVDSSIVSLCLADMNDSKIETFSIGFDKKSFDETDKSRLVAKQINSNHHEFIINESDLKNNVDDILLNFDEPFADSSALPTYLVSNKTRSHVTVALTGDGGDEIFGGYNKYYMGKINNKYTSLVPKVIHEQLKKLSPVLLKTKDDKRGKRYQANKLLDAVSYDDSYYWVIISLGFDESDITELLLDNSQEKNLFEYYKKKTGISAPRTLNDFRTIDRHMSLEGDMLVKVDRTSMLNSLECRAPFLNRKIYDFTLTLPEDFLMNKWSKKHILKKAFEDRFPAGFLEKSKQGFGVPVGDWLRSGLKGELLSYIDPKYLDSQGIFNTSKITELVNNHVEGRKDNTFKVWSFFCFQKWYLNTYSSI